MTMNTPQPVCPLCQAKNTSLFHQDSRTYFHCRVCRLVFVQPHQFCSLSQEKAIYDLHQNSSEDEGYRRFLSRLFMPVSGRLSPHCYGLDFGCGPTPTLSLMFEEAGHIMENYDVFYAPDICTLSKQYDFICASEVVEHLHHPQRDLDKLWSCLKRQGCLGIMTKRVIDQKAFSTWHYKSDPTHVCFYSVKTFQWLAHHWQAQLEITADDVVIFMKQ